MTSASPSAPPTGVSGICSHFQVVRVVCKFQSRFFFFFKAPFAICLSRTVVARILFISQNSFEDKYHPFVVGNETCLSLYSNNAPGGAQWKMLQYFSSSKSTFFVMTTGECHNILLRFRSFLPPQDDPRIFLDDGNRAVDQLTTSSNFLKNNIRSVVVAVYVNSVVNIVENIAVNTVVNGTVGSVVSSVVNRENDLTPHIDALEPRLQSWHTWLNEKLQYRTLNRNQGQRGDGDARA